MSITHQLPLSRSMLDRDAASRTIPGLLEDVWTHPTTRVVAIWRGEVLCHTGDSLRVSLLTPADVPEWDRLFYLGATTSEGDDGLGAGVAIIGAQLTDDQARALEPDVTRWVSGRTSGHALGPRDAGILVEALATPPGPVTEGGSSSMSPTGRKYIPVPMRPSLSS
jgi:NAD+ diphosphatase